jgi:bifunctional NMN adenylyltransferase/nudix hydrolase
MVSIPKDDIVPDVGVLVGRFQVPSLHEGHRDVLDFVAERHDKVILFLGNNGSGQSTRMNPLDFQAREQMIREEYPEFTILFIDDQPEDKYWSQWLDRMIKSQTTASQTVMLYGSRDSFLSHYMGKYPTMELEAEQIISGTEIRNEVKRQRPKNSQEWREGVVAGAFNRFPVNYVTVDIAIFNEDRTEILLGQKEHETRWRLPGGFSESASHSLEEDARREAQEETNLEVTDLTYKGSYRINDWRYRNEVDKIMTVLFECRAMFGKAEGGDDLPRVKWFKIADLDLERDVMPNHHHLLEALGIN